MNELMTFGLLCFTSFFTLVNPLGTMPIFMTMTAKLDIANRNKTAKKASIVSFITILIFAFSGQLLFKFFDISVNSFKIVGGVIFFIMGMDMLQARLGQVKIKDSEIKSYVNDISITPPVFMFILLYLASNTATSFVLLLNNTMSGRISLL